MTLNTRGVRRLGRGACLGLAVLWGVLGARGPELHGQAIPAVLGGVGGFAAGTFTMVGVYVAEARFGKYLYSMDEVLSPRFEILPMVAGPVAGVSLGISNNDRLESAGLWGGVGFLAGTAIGVPLGRLVWGPGEGVWAGGIIGGAVGLVAGFVSGALQEPDVPDTSGEGGGPRIPIGVRLTFP